MTEEMSMPGGWTSAKPVTPEVKKICLQVKSQIEKMAGANFRVYTPSKYASQSVLGMNYVVKVNVGGDKCVHAMMVPMQKQEKLTVNAKGVCTELPCDGGTHTVVKIQYPKKLSDPLVHF